MDSVTFFWAILSTIAAGFQIFLGKVIAERNGSSNVFSFLMYGISLVLSVLLWFFNPILPEFWISTLFFGFLSGFIHGVGNSIRVDSLRNIDSALYFPINKVLGPLLVVLLGVFALGEDLSQSQKIGIVLSFLVPILLITNAEYKRQKNLNKGLLLLVISTVLTAFSMVFVKLGTFNQEHVLLMVVASNLGGMLVAAMMHMYEHRKFNYDKRAASGSACPARVITHTSRECGSNTGSMTSAPWGAFARAKRVPIMPRGFDSGNLYLEKLDKTNWGIGFLSGLLAFVSFYSFTQASSSGLISVVYTINAHYILIPVILSVWWYGEHMNFKKYFALVLSCVTMILLY